jgi:hypothetical protein
MVIVLEALGGRTPRAVAVQEKETRLKSSRHSARRFGTGNTGRHRRPAGERSREHVHAIPLTEAGVPAATPNAPPPSTTVFTTAESRARFPWLPPRVIAGSVWRGPAQERVKVDADGNASPWPPPRP